MRQKTVTDYVILPIMPALHVRKSLIADLSACGVLALVELGLLAFLMQLGLLDPLKSWRYPTIDALFYQAMAQNPFSTDSMVHTGPFCWRVLTPLLVYLLTKTGLSLLGGFLLIATISLIGTVIGVYVLLRLSGATIWQTLAVTLLVQTQYAVGLAGLWDYVRTDPLSYLLLVLAFICYLQNRPRWLLVTLALGVLNRETALFAVAAFAGEQVIHRDWERLKGYLPAYIVPILITIVLRISIYQVGNYLLSELGTTYQVGNYNLLSEIGTTWAGRSALTGRGSTISLFGNVNPYLLNIYHLTINSYGLLLPLFILQLIHSPYTVRRPMVWIFVLVTTISSTVFAGDNERLMIVTFPVFALAAWYELRWLAQRTNMPAAAIGFFLVIVQSIFLLGQFFKTVQDFSFVTAIKLLEPHWMRELWVLSVFVLAGAALAATLWALGFAVRLLYRHVQA